MQIILPPQGSEQEQAHKAVLALAGKVLEHEKAGNSLRASFYRGRMLSAKEHYERQYGPIVA